jgi:hypothetical protein
MIRIDKNMRLKRQNLSKLVKVMGLKFVDFMREKF